MRNNDYFKLLKEQREILGGLIERLGKDTRFSLEDSCFFESATREVERKLRAISAVNAN